MTATAESTAHWHKDVGVELAKLAADLVAYFELPTTATWSWAAPVAVSGRCGRVRVARSDEARSARDVVQSRDGRRRRAPED